MDCGAGAVGGDLALARVGGIADQGMASCPTSDAICTQSRHNTAKQTDSGRTVTCPRRDSAVSPRFGEHRCDGTISCVEFAYRLTGTGWAEARLSDGSASATITASYLGDALGVLLEAVGVLLGGADRARCSWADEPGEFRWIFKRAGSDVVLRVLALADVETPEPDDNGVVVFETKQPLGEVAAAIADGAQAVLEEYGQEEYLRQWVEFPFPAGDLEMIRTQLAAG